jgi:hypothetical protein
MAVDDLIKCPYCLAKGQTVFRAAVEEDSDCLCGRELDILDLPIEDALLLVGAKDHSGDHRSEEPDPLAGEEQ